MTSKYMKADVTGIGKLISERAYFKVPDHQREYSWPSGAVEQFLEDIDTAITNSDPDYFIGLIVLVEPSNDNIWQILDGQQRLATTTMIYSAIRNWLTENGFSKDAQKVQERYIGISELGDEKDRSRITLNVNDRDIFRNTVVEQKSDSYLAEQENKSGRNSSARKLVAAVISCRKHISNLAKRASGNVKKQSKELFKLADFLRDNLHIAYMDVSSSGNAYVIFESLNDRGIDLSVLDLLKNYIFGKAGNDLDEAKNNWIKMSTILGDRKADDFLKVFWTSRYGRVQRGSLFNKIKKTYGSKSQALKLSKELSETVELYAALDSPDSEIWAEHSTITREYVKTLILLGGSQVRPIILASLFRYTPKKIERLLNHLVTLIVRYQTVGGGRTGRLEQHCTSIAPKVYNGDLKTPQTIWDEFKSILPKDGDFQKDFNEYTENTPAKARYILRQLEIIKWKNENPNKDVEKTPIHSPEVLNLEHILPKNPSVEWRAVLRKDNKIVQECVNNIGNLCLLGTKSNKKIGSSGFLKKSRNVYQISDLILTKEISKQYSSWDRNSINARASYLGELAVEAWPV